MRAKTFFRVIAGAVVLLAAAKWLAAAGMVAVAQAAASQWDKPAAELAARIAEVLGPGLVRFTLRNASTISDSEVPAIQRMLEDDLKASGISLAGAEGANTVTVTLSENAAGGLWVAEIGEGNETRVVMVAASAGPAASAAAAPKITLHREVIAREAELVGPAGLRASSPMLAAGMVGNALVVLTTERVAVFERMAQGWTEQARAEFGAMAAGSRDPRGVVVPSVDGTSFSAFAPGVSCAGTLTVAASGAGANWMVQCHRSDDPWPLFQMGPEQWTRGFYNAGRDYFTGVIVPAFGFAVPPFYEAELLPGRPGGAAVLLGTTDGKVELAENGRMEAVAGTRDWGSDFAVIAPACGAAAHVVVSSSGEGEADSLRSFDVTGLEAEPASDALLLNGAAMSMAPAVDGKSAIVVVRTANAQGRESDYEVDRVSEACN